MTVKEKTTIKKKTAAKAKVAPEKDLILETASQVENLTKARALRMAGTLIEDIDHNYFRLGGVLTVIRDHEEWYQDKGYSDFYKFAEDTYSLQKRKAQYFIQIYKDLVESGVTWEQVKDLSWSKLIYLARELTPENVDDWVEKARDLSKMQIEELLKAQKAGTLEVEGHEEEITKMVSMSFRLHEDQKLTIREALDKAKDEAETEYDAVALEGIALNYLSGGKTPSLRGLMKKAGWEKVLELFGEVYPHVYIQASLDEDAGEEDEAEEEAA